MYNRIKYDSNIVEHLKQVIKHSRIKKETGGLPTIHFSKYYNRV